MEENIGVNVRLEKHKQKKNVYILSYFNVPLKATLNEKWKASHRGKLV